MDANANPEQDTVVGQDHDPVEEPGSQLGNEGAPVSDPGREAARYRRQLRQTETERDALASQLDALRRQVVEDASQLVRPAGLWAAGVTPAELFGDDGRLDRNLLRSAVDGAVEQIGLARLPRTPRPDQSQGAGHWGESDSGATWADVISASTGGAKRE